MSKETLLRIKETPEYKDLVTHRCKVIWPIAGLVTTVYFAFILAIAFYPAILSTPVGAGVTSVGIVLGLGIIFFCFAVTGYYTHVANTVLEKLVHNIQQKV